MIGLQILVTEDGSNTLFHPELQETYHSTHGAITESQHVFINQGLENFWHTSRKTSISVFELGFGTGLNALLTALYAESHRLNITYTSLEKFPLSQELANSLNYPGIIGNTTASYIFKHIHQAPWNVITPVSEYFKLEKIRGGIEVYSPCEGQYDLCYFDAFAPSKQPEMWELPVLDKIHRLLGVGGICVTYSAKGQLKRDLKTLGFEVETLPGPPGKKEMVRARKTG